MAKKIFLSVGRTSTEQQKKFVEELENYLKANDLIPQTVGRNYFSSLQPLAAIDDLMRQCSGTIVLALERTYMENGLDKRGGPNEARIGPVKLTTVWNHIEAAMAYTLGQPLLVIIEDTLKEEGLLERYDWYVKKVKLLPDDLQDPEFIGVFADWKRRVEAFAVMPRKAVTAGAVEPVTAPPVETKPSKAPVLQVAKTTPETIKILFLTANPSDTSTLQLDQEQKAIDQALRRAEFRDRFEFFSHKATTVVDLQDCLLRYEPHIVHFSGHGSDKGEIILQDQWGDSRTVSERALGKLFSTLRDNIRCVVLNACYSEKQAKAIAEHIDSVIGMKKPVGDRAAISFTSSFYQALAYGRDVSTAFELGCVQIDLEKLEEQDIPVLLALKTDPKKLFFVNAEG